MKQTSVITRINLAMAAIIVMAISTIMVSYWLSDQADSDAYAINVAGSLRMQSYRLMLEHQNADRHSAEIENIFTNPVMLHAIHNAELDHLFSNIQRQWQDLRAVIQTTAIDDTVTIQRLNAFVDELNTLVLGLQHNAEDKINSLRMFQVIAFFITVILSAVVIYWIHLRFTLPLQELTSTARQISRGDFSCNITAYDSNDELSELSRSFSHMCKAIGYMYESLEKQVEDKTAELRNSNKTLVFLYNIARRISAHEINKDDFDSIVAELSTVTGIDNLELCLLTESGDIPYLQINGNKDMDHECQTRDCRNCINGVDMDQDEVHFPVSRENHDYGVLVVREQQEPLQHWQAELLTSVSSLFAIAMSLQGEEENIRRITLMNERNVIARELHDSLAQALSYLKIQVTRLNRAIGSNNYDVMMDVSAELKQGLDAAYRQLRELLTTFRLKVDGRGLSEALTKTVSQYQEQSSMRITLDYRILNVPLTPQEEIHLLQIIREGCQNAIHHSHGSAIRITLSSEADNSISMAIEDDGIGISNHPEKMNHYGMAIIQERSNQLQGQVKIKRREEGGTGVYFHFTPEHMRRKASAGDSGTGSLLTQ